AGDGDRRRRDRRRVPGQARLPRAQLAGRPRPPGAGAARRSPDRTRRGRIGRARLARQRPRPAPVHARLAATRRASPARPALLTRRDRIRLHVRLASAVVQIRPTVALLFVAAAVPASAAGAPVTLPGGPLSVSIG